MSASQSSSTMPELTPDNKPQLEFNQILEMLQQGLIALMLCFAKNKSQAGQFQADFTADLIRHSMNQKMFNHYGPLMIKAAYPAIFKLTPDDISNLQKMTISHKTQSAEASINQFFLREMVDAFIESGIKEKYIPKMKELVNSIYQFIVTATLSVESEQTLLNFDTKGEPILKQDRKFGMQKTIISPVDLQIGEAIGSVRVASEALIKLKDKTSQAAAISEAVRKINAQISKCSGEYAKNLSASMSAHVVKDQQLLADIAEKAKSDLQQAKESEQSVRLQLEEQQRLAENLVAQKRELERVAAQRAEEMRLREASYKEERERAASVSPLLAELAEKAKSDLQEAKESEQSVRVQLEEQRRLAADLAAENRELARVAAQREAEMRLREESFKEERERAASLSPQSGLIPPSPLSQNSLHVSPSSGVHASAAVSAEHQSMIQQLQKEKQQLERKNRFLHAEAAVKESASKVMEDVKNMHVSSKDLTKIFDKLMAELASPKSTEESILQHLLLWEKAALSYTHHKKPNASATSSAASAIRFLGQKTGLVKKITPEANMALKNELKEVIKQSILVTEMHGDFRDTMLGLNQHMKNLADHYKSDDLQEGAVSSQFSQITKAITAVAEDRFGYRKPSSPIVSGGE
jgi:hypothetical protein